MVSMAPNTLHYNFTHKWENMCMKPDSCTRHHRGMDTNTYRKGTTMDILSSDSRFKKFTKIIQQAQLDSYLENPTYYNTHTIFVTDDTKIPDGFLNSLDFLKAHAFIESYTLKGVADEQYLLNLGDAVLMSKCDKNPILSIVTQVHAPYDANAPHRINQAKIPAQGQIMINKIGRVIGQIKTDNGVIIILDNIANVVA